MALKNLISLKDWSVLDIQNILVTAKKHLQSSNTNNFNNRTFINLFFENSTRTRVSFELAAKRLGMNVININSATSSVKKGETLRDTLLTLQAMQPDIIALRHSESGAAQFAAQNLTCSIINAGDGTHAHPTQALLDAFTIQQTKGKIEGLNIAICGDILHSRVARSNIICLSKLGANIKLIAPPTLLPLNFKDSGLDIYHNMEEGLKNTDVIIMLRIQQERMNQNLIPSLREYKLFYGLTEQKLSYAKEDCIVMHPGPINRGIEITSSIADSKKSYILQQVANGVAIRMALIETLLQA